MFYSSQFYRFYVWNGGIYEEEFLDRNDYRTM